MRRVCLTLATVLIAAACLAAQEPAGSRSGASVQTGSRTITGCVAIGANGYVLKTEDGATTLPLRSITDLSAYVGKKVQINTSWTATGVHVAGPAESAETPATAPGAAPKKAQDFAGDVRLKFQGKVIGDCLGKK